jgi:serine protease
MTWKPTTLAATVGIATLAFVGLNAVTAERDNGLAPEDVAADAALSSALLIDMADDLSAEDREQFLRELPPSTRLNSDFSQAEGLYRVELSDAEVDRWVARLTGDARVEFVEPEFIYTSGLPQALLADMEDQTGTFDGSPPRPNDPLYRFQWNFDQIGAESAWEKSTGVGAVVAVIDTGVAYADAPGGRFTQVRDLSGTRFVPGFDFVNDDNEPYDEHGHGTHVAGTIAQSTHNAYGVAGLAPGATIMPIRVLDGSGRGNTADIAESIRWAADHGANIINMSLGGPLPSRIMSDAIAYAHSRGVTVIAAAGNSSTSLPSYPAAYRHVVSVAATQYDRTTTFYSNYGRTIDIAAPGGNTRVDQNNDGRPDGIMQETIASGNPNNHEFSLYMGTSMASPHVAAVAALIYARGVTDPDRIEAILKASATQDVPTYEQTRYGSGFMQADAAVRAVSTAPAARSGFLGALIAAAMVAAAGFARWPSRVLATGVAAVTATGGAVLLSAPFAGSSCAISIGLNQASGMLHWAPFLSAAVPLGLYAFLGHTSGRVRASVIGTMLGASGLLIAFAVWPTVDVRGILGAATLDSLWLAANGTLGLVLASAAMKSQDSAA